MAKITESELKAALQAQLVPGESIRACGIAYSLPGMWVYFVGAVFVALFQKWYAVGLTERRLLLLRYTKRLQVSEVTEFDLSQMPPVEVKTGPIHTTIRIKGPRGLLLKFHRGNFAENRERATVIGEALKKGAAGTPALPPQAPAFQTPPPIRAAQDFGFAPPVAPGSAKRKETVAEGGTSWVPPSSAGYTGAMPETRPEVRPEVRMQTPRDPAPAVDRKKTRFYSEAPDAAGGKDDGVSAPFEKGSDGRKIVGVLITYSWKPDGQMFAIREGRNLIGRDPQQCDIVISDDQTLGDVNSHITFRKSLTVGDMMASGGTDLDGQLVEEQFRPLPNVAKIRTGATHWTFIAITAAPAK